MCFLLVSWDAKEGSRAVAENQLTTLLSLPNLEELRTYPTINLTTETKKLKKMVLKFSDSVFRGTYVDFDNLADALALMPCLSSLTFQGLINPYENPMILESAARRMKQTILSRGQNIVLYSQHRDESLFDSVDKILCKFTKVAEIPSNMQPSIGEFAIFDDNDAFNRVHYPCRTLEILRDV